VFKRDLAIKFFHLFPQGFSFPTTITLACLINDYDVKYIPINYYKRKGASSIHPIKDFFGFTSLIIKMAVYFKPLKVFTVISLLMLLLAVIIFIVSATILNKIMDITITILVVSSVQIFLFGLIADVLTSKKDR
jgi:hypothetical protein